MYSIKIQIVIMTKNIRINLLKSTYDFTGFFTKMKRTRQNLENCFDIQLTIRYTVSCSTRDSLTKQEQ